MQIKTHNEQETRAFASTFAKTILEKIETGIITAPVILALHGDLGAGKTTFMQGFAQGLGIDEQITSPTFTVVQRYSIPASDTGGSLYHMDCYRLDRDSDLGAIGFNDMLTEKNSIIAIEWPERINHDEFNDAITITFEELSEDTRTITISGLA